MRGRTDGRNGKTLQQQLDVKVPFACRQKCLFFASLGFQLARSSFAHVASLRWPRDRSVSQVGSGGQVGGWAVKNEAQVNKHPGDG